MSQNNPHQKTQMQGMRKKIYTILLISGLAVLVFGIAAAAVFHGSNNGTSFAGGIYFKNYPDSTDFSYKYPGVIQTNGGQGIFIVHNGIANLSGGNNNVQFIMNRPGEVTGWIGASFKATFYPVRESHESIVNVYNQAGRDVIYVFTMYGQVVVSNGQGNVVLSDVASLKNSDLASFTITIMNKTNYQLIIGVNGHTVKTISPAIDDPNFVSTAITSIGFAGYEYYIPATWSIVSLETSWKLVLT